MPPKQQEARYAKISKEVEEHGLDLSSKRMIAAMKITGIQPSDLDPEVFPDDNASEKEVRRFEVKEQKRRNLLCDLQEAAESLDSRDIDALISGPGSVDDQGLFLAEKARIDRQRDRNKAELQRKAALEVESQQIQMRAERDREATTKRVREQKEEKAKQEQQRLETRRQQVEANIKAAREKQNERSKRLAEKLERREEQVNRNMEAIISARNGKIGQLQEKFDSNARRLNEHMRLEDEHVEQKHFHNTTRMSNLEGFLERRQTELHHKQMEKKEDFSGKRNAVLEDLARQAQEREKNALANLKRIEKAREYAASNWSNLSASVKEKRMQRHERWTENRQANIAQRRQKVQKLRDELNTSEARSREVVEKYREDTLGKYSAGREIYNELVQDNKDRMNRSDEITREHRINRINFQKACKESRQDQKMQASSYRIEAFRELVHGQNQVEELHHLLNLTTRSNQSSRAGGSPKRREPENPAITGRINDILENLGVPVPASGLGIVEREETAATDAGGGHGGAQGK